MYNDEHNQQNINKQNIECCSIDIILIYSLPHIIKFMYESQKYYQNSPKENIETNEKQRETNQCSGEIGLIATIQFFSLTVNILEYKLQKT